MIWRGPPRLKALPDPGWMRGEDAGSGMAEEEPPEHHRNLMNPQSKN